MISSEIFKTALLVSLVPPKTNDGAEALNPVT